MHISIHTIEKTLFEGEAESVTLPGVDGELGILENHIPLISSLKHGIIKIHSKKGEMSFNISGGFAEVQPESRVVVLAN